MFWRSVRNTEGKIQTQNTCICAKTNIKELYIQVFWLRYPVCVNKFHFQPPLPTLSWRPYVLSAEPCMRLKKSESLGDHFWFSHFRTSALPNTIQACFPTLLHSAQALAARNTTPANTYGSLPSAAFAGTQCKSAKCKFTRKDSAVKAAGWLFICHKEGPTRERSSSVAWPAACSSPMKVYNLFFFKKFSHINRSLPQYEGNYSEKGMCQHCCSGSF